MFCTRARSCACADDAKIVRSRNAQCKTRNHLKTFATFLRTMATPYHHASNIKADKRSERKYPEQNFWILNHG